MKSKRATKLIAVLLTVFMFLPVLPAAAQASVPQRAMWPLPVTQYNNHTMPLDLTSYDRIELSKVQVTERFPGDTALFPMGFFDQEESIAWGRYRLNFNEEGDFGFGFDFSSPRDHEIISPTDTIDLLFEDFLYDNYSQELLKLEFVTSYNRTIIYIKITPPETFVGRVNLFTVNPVSEVRGRERILNIHSMNYGRYQAYNIILSDTTPSQTFMMGLDLTPKYSAYRVQAIAGDYYSSEDALAALDKSPGLDVTNKLLNNNADFEVAYKASFIESNTEYIGLIFYQGDTPAAFVSLMIQLSVLLDGVSHDWLWNEFGLPVAESDTIAVIDDVMVITFTMLPGYEADGQCYFKARLILSGRRNLVFNDLLRKAVLGHYDTYQAAEGQPDIKDDLFPVSPLLSSGYAADYSDGVDFTAFLPQNDIGVKMTVKTEPSSRPAPETMPAGKPSPLDYDLYFFMSGAFMPERIFPGTDWFWIEELPEGGVRTHFGRDEDYVDEPYRLGTYYVPAEHDTNYDIYQTLLVSYSGIDKSVIVPEFWTHPSVNIYVDRGDGKGAVRIESGELIGGELFGEAVDFSKGPVQFSAVSEDGVNLKNYWVTFVERQEDGPHLFVNGANSPDGNKRELFLSQSVNDVHDIFIANLGDVPINGLNAYLSEDTSGVLIHPYWAKGGPSNDNLYEFNTNDYHNWTNIFDFYPFFTDHAYSYIYGEMYNLAKIRLLSDGSEGDISGTLYIDADYLDEPIGIELSGFAGNPRITAESVPEAVQYVPYSTHITNNDRYNWNRAAYEIIEGRLPEGLRLMPNGEIYGSPMENGVFTFTVRMTNSDSRFTSSTATLTLTVNENTNANVWGATDDGYGLVQPIGAEAAAGSYDFVLTSLDDQDLISEGSYNEFIDLWLNGVRLVEGADYVKDSGSTRITIRSQTFGEKASSSGRNTIAMEFRNQNDQLMRSAQNFRLRTQPSR